MKPFLPTQRKEEEILTSFLSDSLPGEYDQCFQALMYFVKDKRDLLAEIKQKTVEPYLLKYNSYLNVDSHHGMAICDESRRGDGLYYDPIGYKIRKYDYLTKTISETSTDPRASKFQRSLQEQLENSFFNGNFPPSCTTCCCYDTGEHSYTVIVNSSFNSSNAMMSRYIVHKFLIDMPKNYRIIGQTYLIEHCYRGKNVLLRSQANMEKCEINSLENEAVIIEQIVKVITRYDAEWEKSINKRMKFISNDLIPSLLIHPDYPNDEYEDSEDHTKNKHPREAPSNTDWRAVFGKALEQKR